MKLNFFAKKLIVLGLTKNLYSRSHRTKEHLSCKEDNPKKLCGVKLWCLRMASMTITTVLSMHSHSPLKFVLWRAALKGLGHEMEFNFFDNIKLN